MRTTSNNGWESPNDSDEDMIFVEDPRDAPARGPVGSGRSPSGTSAFDLSGGLQGGLRMQLEPSSASAAAGEGASTVYLTGGRAKSYSPTPLNFDSYARRFDEHDAHESLAMRSLRNELMRSETLPRVIDLFRKIDTDGSQRISRAEFMQCKPLLKCARAGVVDVDDFGELFDAIDTDRSGQLEYSELHSLLRTRAPGALGPALRPGAVHFDVRKKGAAPQRHAVRRSTHASPAREQRAASVDEIRAALARGLSRVIDFFKAIDANGDGKITRAEWRHALPNLGFAAGGAAAVDELYDTFDLDGDGLLEFRELHTILRYEARRLGVKGR